MVVLMLVSCSCSLTGNEHQSTVKKEQDNKQPPKQYNYNCKYG